MKKILKWIGMVVGALIVLLIVTLAVLHLVGRGRLDAAPEVSIAAVAVLGDPAAVERGRHLATISSCNYCHGANLQGMAFVDEAPIGYIPAANLTANGIGATYSDEDWAGAIRHGVAGDGRVITIMPAVHYAAFGDDDLAQLIAYLKSVPPAGITLGPRRLQFPGTIIFGMLAYDSWSVNQIEHAAVGGRDAPPVEPTAEYGEYLVSIASCASCHGENLAGNTPGADSPKGPNITPGGSPGDWTLADFTQAMQTGQTPDGRRLDSDEMPWPNYAAMSEVEVEALWEYLRSLDPLPANR